MPQSVSINIPDEIWEQIMSFLPHDRFLRPLSLVSKRFLAISNRLKKTLIISKPALYFLRSLLTRFPNLRHFIFSEIHASPGPVFDRISSAHYSIETLDLSNLRNFDFNHIQRLCASSLASVKSLNLSGRSVFSDLDLEVIGGLMGNLVELDLSYHGDSGLGITDEGVGFLASKLGKLSRINLSGNRMISDKSVVCLADKCKDLEEIGVKNCNVTHNGVSYVMCNAINLKSLSLYVKDLMVQEICDSFVCARNLAMLEFSYMSVSDRLLFAVAKANFGLKKFTLDHCWGYTFSGVLLLLRTYQSLEYLVFEGPHWLCDGDIIDMTKFLCMVTTVRFNLGPRMTSSSLFALLKNCPLLSHLEMNNTLLGEREFCVSNSMNVNVRTLFLGLNRKLNDECLEKIASLCPSLEFLDISACTRISSKGIAEILRHCTGLRHLVINRCEGITNLGMDGNLTKLETLRALGSGLNDEGLIAIARKCPALMYLDMARCAGVTARGVEEVVKHCGRLKEINLSWCHNIDCDMIAWMVFSGPSLRNIVPPYEGLIKDDERGLFLRHGCYVGET